MPQLIIPLLSGLGLGGALGLGTTIYGLTQGGGGDKTSAVPALTGPVPQSDATNRAQQANVSSALPTLQALTGGSTSPEYAAQYGATQSGLGNTPQATGNIQAALNQFFGLAAPGETGLTPGPSGGTSITDLLARGGPGGGGRETPSGGGGSNIIDSLLNSDQFKGLAYA